MDLNNIKREGTWKEIAEDLNDNFNKISIGMDELSVVDTSDIIHIGTDEPEGDVLWADPNESSISEEDNEELVQIRAALNDLQSEFNDLKRLQTIGIIPGNSTNGYRRILMASATPEDPNPSDEDIPTVKLEDETTTTDEDKPDTSIASNTVTCICAKMDTASNFTINKQDLIDGELIFYTDRLKFAVYYGGKFYSSGSGDSGSGGDGISVDDLYQISLEKLNFTNGTNQYRVTVNDKGKWVVRQYKDTTTSVGNPDDKWGNYVSQYLCMNSIYIGGNKNENCSCTHNYIELANASKNDINLKGLHLLYTDGTKEDPSDIGYKWDVLDLEGVIKSGSTFVIRGGECNDAKNALINVDNYDIIWYKDGEPIRFNQGPSSFYLCVGDDYKTLLENKTLNNPWQSTSTRVGYIDSCGFGSGSVGEGSSTFTVSEDWNKLLFVRWYMLDPSKQGNKAYSSRKTTDLWTYINIDTQTTRQGNSIQYYYNDEIKQKYTPMASYLGKTFFTNKTRFSKDHANYINITFGIQATDNGEGATRCFNWVSVGNYDEYVEYRKKGESSWIRSYSITDKNSSNPDWITKYIDQYKRFRWCGSDGTWVTTHKAIIKNLEKGNYEYRIGRDNNINYTSNILEFKIEADEDVTNFSFIHISDQQGFNWAEYTAWWKSSYVIKRDESNFNFLINTGDITQSGNRPNEWLDYYTGKELNMDKCEMFSIGNNDLCGHVSTELTNGEDATSKYSHINVLRYFCFELDPENDINFNWGDNGKFPIYSLYSFNYGKFHFISLNSEIAIATSKMYKDWESDSYAGDRTFAEEANAHIEEWLKKDLQIWKKTSSEPTDCSKCIVYMHEMPFTIVTWDFMKGESARVGSHLNTLNSNGLYRFSRLFKKYGIRLVLGGHKHTYSISKPIYDAPSGYITSNNTIDSGVDLMGVVGTEESRKPVIQVTRSQDIKESEFARYELISKINAPTYVMSQATGYKLVSNKEQPSGPEYTIPWLLSYFKAKTNASSPTENVKQHYPMYIKYDVSDTTIKITAKQVQNIWNVNVDNNTKKFDMNNQLIDTSANSMTLSQISDEDKEAYSISDLDSLTLNI